MSSFLDRVLSGELDFARPWSYRCEAMGQRMAVLGRYKARVGGMLACLACLLLSCKEKKQPAVEQHEDVASVKARAWTAGARYAYRTELRSKLAAAGKAMMSFTMYGQLTLEAREKSGETEFLAQLSDVKFTAEDSAQAEQFEPLARELAAPFGFSTQDGKLVAVRMRPDWTTFAASIARTLAAGLQFVEPQAGSREGKTWMASEADATGSYVAEYTLTNSARALAKRKLRYESIPLGKLGLAQLSGGVKPEVLESKGSLLLGASPGQPRIAKVEYGERLKITLSPSSLLDSETELKLVFDPGARPASKLAWDTALAETRRQAPNEARTSSAPNVAYDSERIGDYTFDKALRELEQQGSLSKGGLDLIDSVRGEPLDPDARDARKAKFAAEGRVFAAMAALMRQDPENVSTAAVGIRQGSKAQRALLDALSSAGSPEAQKALVDLMEDAKLKPALRSAAAFSLTRTAQATGTTVSALERHLGANDALRVHALYGLGTIARHLRDAGQTARAEAIVATLVQALVQATTPAAKAEVLRGIANSGGATAFPAIPPLLKDKSAKVRAAAIDALRLMVHPEVDAIVAGALAQPEQNVQMAVIDAISVREPSPVLVRALESAVGTTYSSAIRVRAVRVIGHWLARRPDLRKTLERLAENDPAEAVRKAARAALGS